MQNTSYQSADIAGAHIQKSRCNWLEFARSLPIIFLCTSWLVWLLFLVIPTAFGLHSAPLFPLFENALYVLMGLVLCTSATIAFFTQEAGKSGLFIASVLLLAYWF